MYRRLKFFQSPLAGWEEERTHTAIHGDHGEGITAQESGIFEKPQFQHYEETSDI